ncbi:helix-turn-helix domain-containing protein [Streptomyces sp. NPDC046925]|uniref:helix-turn-helix domain-containing protein n=1 Tax=Streptomyces sp. NPDC046925 TaxID=3155375 RepID=UPI0033FA0DF0
MTASDQGPAACANPSCPNIVEQGGARAGRPRRYCSDSCGRAYRKRHPAEPAAATNHEYAVQVADDCSRRMETVYKLVRDGQPLGALRQLRQLESDLADLTAATVTQARDNKRKASDIAGALSVTPDTVSRKWSVKTNNRRRQTRLARLQPPPPTHQPSGARQLPRQRPSHRPPSAASSEQDPGGSPGAAADPASALGRALSHLHRTHDRSQRSLGQEAGVSASYVSRIFSGERLPTWKVANRLTLALGAAPEDLRPLWDAARGEKPPAKSSLPAALRGLLLANASPSYSQLSARTQYALSAAEIAVAFGGASVPEWDTVDRLVTALHGRPDTVRPLWNAAKTALPDAARPSVPLPALPAESFG